LEVAVSDLRMIISTPPRRVRARTRASTTTSLPASMNSSASIR